MKAWLQRGRRLAQTRCPEKLLCALVLCGAAVTLIPVLWIGYYDVPCVDDFSFGASPHRAWLETGSLLAVLRAAAQNVHRWYMGWQGTFSAIFLMSLQPAVFSEGMYRLVPLIMVGGLAVGVLSFSWAFFRKWFGATRPQFLMVAAVWLLLSVQLAPSAVEAFYWYNGALYYTGFFSVSLVYFGLMILCVLTERASRRRVYVGILCVLGIVLGGGNYVTALLSALVTVLALAVLTAKRSGRWKCFVLPLVLLAGAFVVSIAAPGNQIRQAELESPGALYAIGQSLIAAAASIGDNLDVLHLLVLAFLGIVLWRMAGNTAFQFPMPLLVGIVSFGLYAAQFCPPIYAMNNTGPGRLQNIIYDTFLLLATLNLFYVLGWIRSHYRIASRNKRPESAHGYSAGMLVALGAAALLCCAAVPRETPITGTRALQALRSGAAEQYYQEYQQRREILEDETQTDVVLQPFTQRPYVLYFSDAVADPEDWRNEAMAHFYGKDRIVVSD